MSLEEKLETIRQGSAKRLPPERLTIMSRATRDLRDTGIVDKAIKAGDVLPPFSLNDAFGKEIRSADLLAGGPLVLTVFRGSW